MSIKKEKQNKKRKTDSDGVKVKRSYYSFSKYYPGGGSEQKYLRVMHETPDEHRNIKIILSIFALLTVAFIGYFSTTVALDISNAPTTTAPFSTQSATAPSGVPDADETESETTAVKTTLEEPEREVNVTTTLPPDASSPFSAEPTTGNEPAGTDALQ
ncbi:MAG: hypothetical protein PUB94_00090 [Oscillospiraceae bacterium]|nr:hypothetical protein [Oscillospiraceae bacterium]